MKITQIVPALCATVSALALGTAMAAPANAAQADAPIAETSSVQLMRAKSSRDNITCGATTCTATVQSDSDNNNYVTFSFDYKTAADGTKTITRVDSKSQAKSEGFGHVLESLTLNADNTITVKTSVTRGYASGPGVGYSITIHHQAVIRSVNGTFTITRA